MNINPEYNESDSDINAMTMMQKSMGILWESFIEPAEADMDEEQIAIVGLIGMTFQIIAEKAYAYEKLMGQVPNEDEEESNPFTRN
jgi:hypothetical protein